MKEIKLREEKKYLTKSLNKYQITINIILVMIQQVIVVTLKQIKKAIVTPDDEEKPKKEKNFEYY